MNCSCASAFTDGQALAACRAGRGGGRRKRVRCENRSRAVGQGNGGAGYGRGAVGHATGVALGTLRGSRRPGWTWCRLQPRHFLGRSVSPHCRPRRCDLADLSGLKDARWVRRWGAADHPQARPTHSWLLLLNRTRQTEQLVLCQQDERQRLVNGGLNRAARLDRVNESITLFRAENMNGAD
jgi:hypothetical protein